MVISMKIFLFAHNDEKTRFTSITSLGKQVELNADKRHYGTYRDEGYFIATVANAHPGIENYKIINLIDQGSKALEYTGAELQKLVDDMAPAKYVERLI